PAAAKTNRSWAITGSVSLRFEPTANRSPTAPCLGAADLARWADGEAVNDCPRLGDLEVREALEQVCSAFLENGGRGAAPGHDDGADFLAPFVTRTAEDTG